ncbi:uncharacterized protein LOC122381642 [Amphibalanus amphitrite]|uniref:uncharacterized protein LOC122381642 n=1 Tax=Amphibalanus amphitrite TaxID=1232801 RepID=UPI001C908044|nr:uncharacterized protein LOC122381642 [Amphibalanus amphitrite]
MNSSDTYSSAMGPQEVVWLRVRGRDGERQIRKKLRVSLRQLATLDLAQFRLFLKEKLELERSPSVSYSDDEGDEIPVTSDSELNVMVYMAEMLARQSCALEVRLRERTTPNTSSGATGSGEPSLTSARQLAKRDGQRVGSAERAQRRQERRRCELHAAREPRRPPQQLDVRPVPAAPADPLWARVDAWQQACMAGGTETPEDGWRPPHQQPEVAHLEQPSRGQPLPPPPPAGHQTLPATAHKREKRRDIPPWFASFMGQFQKELVSEVVTAVKSELANAPVCLCGAPRATDSDQAAGGAEPEEERPPSSSVAVSSLTQPDGLTTPKRLAEPPVSDPISIPGKTRGVPPAPASSPVPAKDASTGTAAVPAVEKADTGVQTTPPAVPADGPDWLRSLLSSSESPAAAAAAADTAPVDRYGLFSVSESSPGGVGVSYGSGGSVAGVHSGVTVYSAGGRSVETTAATGGGRPALLRSAYSVPAGRPQPRPRRRPTDVDEADSCMLVMVEHSAAELEPFSGAAAAPDDVLAGPETEQSRPEEASAAAPQPEETVREEGEGREEEGEGQEVHPPVTVAQWLASEPPTPPAATVGDPELETVVKQPASAPEPQEQEAHTEQQSQQRQREPAPVQEQPREADQEPELEEGFVTVNGRRLSLSEDDFSDIVIISSPGGSERFEMVEEVAEELEEALTQHQRQVQQQERQQQQQQQQQAEPPVQATSDAAGDPMMVSALSDRWVDAAASLEDSGSAGSLSGWAASSAGSELLRSTCESAPAACHIAISSPPAGAAQTTVSLPAGVKLSPVSASARQPPIPEQPAGGEAAGKETEQETQETEQETQQETQQEAVQETVQETEPQQPPSVVGAESAGLVSLMDPLSALSEPLLRRLAESLQLVPESRQMQLASALTGRRFVEAFWASLVESAAAAGRSPMEELLHDQAARPAGVGVLADALDTMLRHIKVSATSSSQLDGMGAQAVKHALCLLRDAIRAEEKAGLEPEVAAAAGRVWTPPRMDELRQERQREAPREAPRQQQPEPEPAPRQEPLSGQQRSSDGRRSSSGSPTGPSSPEPALDVPTWLSSLVGLLPERVLNMLTQGHRRGVRESTPSEVEALVITRLVEMGFYDLDRMRELFAQLGADVGLIASHLLDAEV